MAWTQRTTEQIIGLAVEDEVKLSQGVTVGDFKLQCAPHYGLSRPTTNRVSRARNRALLF